MTINDIKQTIGENTEKLEKKVKELSPYYTNLEPYQRGLILLGILGLTALTIYWLTKEDKDKLTKRKAKEEAMIEERILKRMELFKRLRE